MTPLYFGKCFGWLHSANGGRGVVICPAMGVEELCTHRLIRHLADDLAAAGMPTLRFDYHGTGDSAGTDFDVDRVSSWINSILQAVETLKLTTGVKEVALVGVRLGALLAAEVAHQLGDIRKLVLLGTVPSGKQYITETRALGMLIAHSLPNIVNAKRNDAEIEAAGFYLTSQTVSDLRGLDLFSYSRPPAPKILVTGAQTNSDLRLTEHLRSMDCEVEQAELPGYAALEWNSSYANLPPDAFAYLVSWLAERSPFHTTSPTAILAEQLVDKHWCEYPERFGVARRLFSIHCCSTRQPSSLHRQTPFQPSPR